MTMTDSVEFWVIICLINVEKRSISESLSHRWFSCVKIFNGVNFLIAINSLAC